MWHRPTRREPSVLRRGAPCHSCRALLAPCRAPVRGAARARARGRRMLARKQARVTRTRSAVLLCAARTWMTRPTTAARAVRATQTTRLPSREKACLPALWTRRTERATLVRCLQDSLSRRYTTPTPVLSACLLPKALPRVCPKGAAAVAAACLGTTAAHASLRALGLLAARLPLGRQVCRLARGLLPLLRQSVAADAQALLELAQQRHVRCLEARGCAPTLTWKTAVCFTSA
jgi:hypothetical protein